MAAPAGPSSYRRPRRFVWLRGVFAVGLVAALVALAPVGPATASPPANAYHQTHLVSDLPGLAQLTDPDLVNPWGLAAGPTTPIWVADNGTGKATIYPGFVNGSPIQKAPLVVNVPGGAPTGQGFTGTPGFEVHSGAARGPALFLFDSEAGLVTGWNPGVPPPPPSTQAQVGARVRHAIYKGLAIATTSAGTFLYAADFHTRASTSSTPASTGSTCRAASGTASCHAAMRPSTSRSWVGGCMSPTPSRTPTGRTRSPARAAASWTSTAPAGICCAAWSAGGS